MLRPATVAGAEDTGVEADTEAKAIATARAPPPTGVWSGYHGCTVRTRDRRMVMQLPSRRQIRAMMKMKSIRATGGIKDEGDEPSVPGDDNGEKILEWFKVDTNGHPMLDDQRLRIPRSPDTETREPKRRRF
eukprot:SAG25_NODE_15_length_24441_cov_175.207288_6_plen_132_part_00